MLDPASQTALPGEQSAVPQGSAWQVYGRLVGYAWNYKGRLVVSLLFALLIAASFGSMLVSVGTVVKLTFYEPPESGEAAEPDPADDLAADISAATDRLRDTTGWAPAGLDERFLALVAGMRDQPMEALIVVCILVVGLAFIIGIARFLQEYFAGSIGASITTDLGYEMYRNLMRQSVGFFEKRTSGEILARFTNDIFMVNRGLAGVFVKLMREPLKAATFLAIAISVDPVLTLVGVGVLPPVVYVLVRIGKKVRRSVRRSLQKVASMASVVNETVQGIAIVKSYNMEQYELQRVQKEIKKLRRFLFQMVRQNAATGPITEFLLVLGVVAFVLLSGQRVVAGQLGAGELTQLYFALAMMLDPVRKLSSVNNMVQTSVASAERVFEFIDQEPEIKDAPDAVPLAPLAHSLRFNDVWFSYDGKRDVLRGIDFEIEKGQVVALVGFSGAGKSTLVKLIPRFYDVSRGSITYDGRDIRKAATKSLRDQISVVTQDTILFAETIRNIITAGDERYTDTRVREAAEAAHAAEFIEDLPGRYDAVLGQAGGTLSGGQRQRLAIARAIIKDPSILILDEATSSLDSESERLIQDALDRFIEGRTAVVIAHRLSTIQRADRILVLDHGRIVEDGTHETLLEHGGIYRRLYDTQFGVPPSAHDSIRYSLFANRLCHHACHVRAGPDGVWRRSLRSGSHAARSGTAQRRHGSSARIGASASRSGDGVGAARGSRRQTAGGNGPDCEHGAERLQGARGEGAFIRARWADAVRGAGRPVPVHPRVGSRPEILRE